MTVERNVEEMERARFVYLYVHYSSSVVVKLIMFIIDLHLKMKIKLYIWRTYQRRAYILSFSEMMYECFIVMRFLILVLRKHQSIVKSPTLISLTPCLLIRMPIFLRFGQFLHCLIIKLIFKHQSSAGVLVTSNNGSNPPGPFALSNIADVCPNANME